MSDWAQIVRSSAGRRRLINAASHAALASVCAVQASRHTRNAMYDGSFLALVFTQAPGGLGALSVLYRAGILLWDLLLIAEAIVSGVEQARKLRRTTEAQ